MKRDDIETSGWILTAILAAGEEDNELLSAHIEQARKTGGLDGAAEGLAIWAADAWKVAYGDKWAEAARHKLTILEIERIDAEE